MASDTIKLIVEESPAFGLQHIFDLVTSQELFEADDSVVLKYNYSFPSSPVTRDSVSYMFKNDSCILANVYYSVGDLTMPEGGKDTINLGTLPPNNYSLILHVVGNVHVYTDSDTLTLNVTQGSNGINRKTLNGIYVYPNPAMDELFISYHTSFKIDAFSIHAINGQMIKSANIEDLSESIDISDIPGGMYVIKFYSKKSIFSVNKFIKGNL